MIEVGVFRVGYAIVVIVGLLVNLAEWHEARGLRDAVVRARLNGSLLTMASNAVREEFARVVTQCFLALVASGGLLMMVYPSHFESRALWVWIVIQCGHTGAAVSLMVSSLRSRYDRLLAMDIVMAEEAKAKELPQEAAQGRTR